MPFVLDKDGQPLVRRDPNANWDNDAIQFARLIAEMEAVGFFSDVTPGSDGEALLKSMDLEPLDLGQIVGRAQAVWDRVKSQL